MDFSPFVLCAEGQRPAKPRHVDTPEGLGDRLRSAAFAEFQAIEAFRWAVEHFDDVPAQLRRDWAAQIPDEIRHYELIRRRMSELEVSVTDRPVSAALWESLEVCTTGRQFCLRMVNAEERGRQAALQLADHLADSDPDTTRMLREIAADEVGHVALAVTYFGEASE